MMEKAKILVSSCMLGNNVRYDGGNKLDGFIDTKLSQFFELQTVCPEVQMGLSIPREPVNLVMEKNGSIKMLGSKSKIDHTDNAKATSQLIINENLQNISGAILQKKSPSCGVERVKLYNEKDELIYNIKATPQNRGIFASMLMEQRPNLPVIDSGRFFDKDERDNFLRRVTCYDRFYKLDGSIKELQNFHARYKFVIMEHHQEKMRNLGAIAANSNNLDPKLVYEDYAKNLFETMAKIPTRKSRTNVFFHLIGFFKNELSSAEKSIINQMITDYNANQLPYLVPLKMIEFLINKHQQYYLKNHYILDQYPKGLLEN